MKLKDRSFRGLAGLVAAACCLTPVIRAAEERLLKDEAGKTIAHYIVEAPAGIAPVGTTDPAKQVGLIFCFQEHGTLTGSDLFPVRETLRRLGLTDQYVLLAPHSQDPHGKMLAADHDAIKKLVAWAEKTYPINPRRVYLYGKGEGGKISGEFTMMHPELATAAISYSWGWWVMPSDINKAVDPKTAPEFYMVVGERDYWHHLATVRDTYEKVKFKGYHVIDRESATLGERSYDPTTNDDAIRWVTRLRNKNIPPSAEEEKLLKAFSKGTPAPVSGYYPTLALVGGAPAGAIIQKLLVSSDARVRAAAAETCRHAIFDEATTAVLAKLISDPSASVRGQALIAVTAYAGWRSEAAQQALIQVALDNNADLERRIDAADAIAQAVKLEAGGVRQDPAMFKALVALNELKNESGKKKYEPAKPGDSLCDYNCDKYEPLNAIAFLALAPIRTYKWGGADEGQSAPAGGWQKWLKDTETEQAGDLAYYDVCNANDGRPRSAKVFLRRRS